VKHWKQIVISPDTSILDAIKLIDAGQVRIVLVTDEKERLLGTVTDGDVRRGILRGVCLSEDVRRVMQKEPVIARRSDSNEKIQSLMRRKLVQQVPILDRAGKILQVHIAEDLLEPLTRPNQVLIMAGGMGERLRPLTEGCPKPLLKVSDKPILETALENMVEQGFRSFTMAVHYKDHMIKEHFGDGARWGVSIRYLKEERSMGTGGALRLLPEKPKEPFLVLNADILTTVNFGHLLDFHRQHRSRATLSVREYDFQVPFGVARIRGNHLAGLDEKPVQRFFVNAGIYVLEPEVFKVLPRKKERFDMTHVIDILLKKQWPVTTFPVREYWIDVGRFDDLERAQGDFEEVFNNGRDTNAQKNK